MKSAIKRLQKFGFRRQFCVAGAPFMLAMLSGCDQKSQNSSGSQHGANIPILETLNQEKPLPRLDGGLNSAISVQELLDLPPVQQLLTVDELVKLGSPMRFK